MLDLDAGGGANFAGDGVCPRRMSGGGGSLPVSSELLNMLLHITLGRWWGGFIRWVSPGRAGLFIP